MLTNIEDTTQNLKPIQEIQEKPKRRRLRKNVEENDLQSANENIEPNHVISQPLPNDTDMKENIPNTTSNQSQQNDTMKNAENIFDGIPYMKSLSQLKQALEPMQAESPQKTENLEILKNEPMPESNESKAEDNKIENKEENKENQGKDKEYKPEENSQNSDSELSLEPESEELAPIEEKKEDDIDMGKFLKTKMKTKNKLFGEIEDTTILDNMDAAVHEEEPNLKDEKLVFDTSNRKKKTLDFLSKFITQPMQNVPIHEDKSEESKIKPEDAKNTDPIPIQQPAQNLQTTEQLSQPIVNNEQKSQPQISNIEFNCTETLCENKPRTNSMNGEKYVELDIEIEPEKPKEIVPQVQDRNKLLNSLTNASKKRRSKHINVNTLKELVQETELISNNKKCIFLY